MWQLHRRKARPHRRIRIGSRGHITSHDTVEMLSSAAGGEGGRGGEPVATDTLAAASAPAKKRLLTRSATVPHSMTMPTSVSVEVCARSTALSVFAISLRCPVPTSRVVVPG